MPQLTDRMIQRLNVECLKRCRLGRCRMECELASAKLGWCQEVWEALKKKKK